LEDQGIHHGATEITEKKAEVVIRSSLFRHSGESRNPGATCRVLAARPWIPAFAGLTEDETDKPKLNPD
jgi:hypothetical protein